jgi:hypothetical protein
LVDTAAVTFPRPVSETNLTDLFFCFTVFYGRMKDFAQYIAKTINTLKKTTFNDSQTLKI